MACFTSMLTINACIILVTSYLGVIQKALRHKKIQTTMIYADATGDMVKKEVRRIEQQRQTMNDINRRRIG
ncbi:hypothetical protein [Campylobacter concisus]|uniref:hypothetical protein n=1 Tax=Campylobacter concisus TaxID=199 RepID=UPI000CD8861C|nr:hypothetical protein [Campylobacter concisus]